MDKEDYNKEWINLSQQMQRLEIKKIELYNLYRKEYGPLDLKIKLNNSIFFISKIGRAHV